MKIITRQGILHTELFQEIMRHEQLGIITFSYGYIYDEDNGEGPTYVVQIPMTFKNARDCREAFRRYLHARNTGKDSVSFIALGGHWPRKTYKKILRHKSLKLLDL